MSVYSIVTRWSDTNITQFFIQDGKKIDMPAPVWDGLPKEGVLSADMCSKQPDVFEERDEFRQNGGWAAHNKQLLDQPMVLVMSINSDVNDSLHPLSRRFQLTCLQHFAWNTWLDSVFPPEKEGSIGAQRGDCLPYENNDPQIVQNKYPAA